MVGTPENPDGNCTCPVTANAVRSPPLIALQLSVNCDPPGIEAGRLHDGVKLGPETVLAGLLKATAYGSEPTPASVEVAISTVTTAPPDGVILYSWEPLAARLPVA